MGHGAGQEANCYRCSAKKIDIDAIEPDLFGRYVSLSDLPAVDLLIRTGGDFRLSNFLLWQAFLC